MLGAVLGGLASGAMSFIGQREANRTNRDIATHANIVSAREAHRNRVWQEHMSNTSYQRAVADLNKAGLNPLLAIKGGASSPGGATASAHGTQVQNELGMAVSSASQAAQVATNIKKAKEEVSNLKEMNKNIQKDSEKKSAETAKLQTERKILKDKSEKEGVLGEVWKSINEVMQVNPKKQLQKFKKERPKINLKSPQMYRD